MRRVIWRDPNFHVTVTDQGDRISEELHAADNQAEVESRLQKRVDQGYIKSFAVKPYDFSRWKRRAADATADAIAYKVVAEDYKVLPDAARQQALEQSMQARVFDPLTKLFAVDPAGIAPWEKRAKDAVTSAIADKEAGKKWDFNGKIWADLKDYLIVLFHGKCAYCDGKFDRNDWGDVEHYRPKRQVTDANGVAIDHPGYYWLAYQTSNLLPSCKLCNQGKGKANQFPIDPEEKRVRTPLEDLKAETPLLLNAYVHNPIDHLKYVARIKAESEGAAGEEKSLGTIEAKDRDPVGESSKMVYWLNRAALIEYRRKLQGDARLRAKKALFDEKPNVISEMLAACLAGSEEFSGSIYAEVTSYLQAMTDASQKALGLGT